MDSSEQISTCVSRHENAQPDRVVTLLSQTSLSCLAKVLLTQPPNSLSEIHAEWHNDGNFTFMARDNDEDESESWPKESERWRFMLLLAENACYGKEAVLFQMWNEVKLDLQADWPRLPEIKKWSLMIGWRRPRERILDNLEPDEDKCFLFENLTTCELFLGGFAKILEFGKPRREVQILMKIQETPGRSGWLDNPEIQLA